MTKTKSTKRALLTSALALVMCVSMLIGSTFAWFTDSVTSSGNIIKSGKLEVGMYWAEGNLDPTTVTDWKDASQGAIFKSELWEPGYTEAKHIKIANEGNLALKYQMRILANGVVSVLANVIDVYYLDSAAALTRNSLASAVKLGTLSEVLNNTTATAISKTVSGSLLEDETKTVTIAFKMQERAGNEYQNLSIGTDFSIQLLATQYTSEIDSFDEKYDANADFPPQEKPSAMVFALSESKLKGINIGGVDGGATLDTGYSFQPTETYEQSLASEYSWAHADFFVYSDAPVPANSMALAGYYKAFDGLSFGGQTLSETNWIGLTANTDIAAGKANGIRLIADGMNGGVTNSGITIPYNAICLLGNDGTGFLCGAADLTGANSGATLTVELRLYKTYPEGECPADHNGHSSQNCETGEYITVGVTKYTFPERPLTVKSSAELSSAFENGAENIVLGDDIVLTSSLRANKDAVIDLNGNTITAPSNGDMFHSLSNAAPSMTITSSTPGAEINISGGDTSVLLGYGSTVIKNVTINIKDCDNYSPNPFKAYGDLTLGEGTVVNVDYLGTALISNNGAHKIVIDGAKINIGKFKTNSTAIITLNKASTLEIKNTTMKIDEFVLSQFGGEGLVNKVDGVTIENCTFDVTDSNGASCTFVADAGLGRYDLVQK